MSDMSCLAQLAINPQNGASREEIYLAVAFALPHPGRRPERARARIDARNPAPSSPGDVEMAIRVALAQRLSEDTTAPHDLILLLVDDAIEVARLLIMHSPLLSETDVLKLIAEAGVAHQEAVAGRPNISEPVTAALARCENERSWWPWCATSPPAFPKPPMACWSRSPAPLPAWPSRWSAVPTCRRSLPAICANGCRTRSRAISRPPLTVAPRKIDSAMADASMAMHSEPPAPKNPPADSARS